MSRLISILLIVLALFLMVSCDNKPNEEEIVKEGILVTEDKPLADILKEMNLESATELVLTGTLKEADFATLKAMATLKHLDIGNVSNTEIPQRAFAESSFETIVLPKNLEKIGEYAFAISSLKEVDIPNKVTRLEEGCFFKSKNLTKLHIPVSVEYIGGCIIQQYDYKADKMPEDAQYITVIIDKESKELVLENGAFVGGKIKEINIPESVKVIPNFCFAQTFIDKIELPETIERIGFAAFENSWLILKDNTFTMPRDLRILGPRALAVQNDYSYKVKFNEKLEYIYQEAFVTGFAIEEFDFPATLKGFAKSSISTRTGLKRVVFRGTTPPELIPYYDTLQEIKFEDGKYVGVEDEASFSPQDSGVYSDVVAYVPKVSVIAYQNKLKKADGDVKNPFKVENIKSIEELIK